MELGGCLDHCQIFGMPSDQGVPCVFFANTRARCGREKVAPKNWRAVLGGPYILHSGTFKGILYIKTDSVSSNQSVTNPFVLAGDWQKHAAAFEKKGVHAAWRAARDLCFNL